MKKITFYILSLFVVIPAIAQNNLNDKKHYNDTYIPAAVLNEKYGVTMYEKLTIMLGGDTVMNDQNGYAANGYLEDYYTTGQLLHKGFYVDGQLKVYKNYFPNGQVERNFRLVDLKKSKMDIFYKDGTQKSKIVYITSEPLIWEEYYPSGTLEFVEAYDKHFQYYVEKGNYYENGTPENTLVLENKKKLLYTQTYYHPNGEVKELGQMKYNKAEFDYQNIGIWKKFDKNGKPTKVIKYASGQIQSEKDL
jgi:antitoxin component YwqK of YwqJK toxin-antitoxin module